MNNKKQYGFAFLEVLLASLVLSVGVVAYMRLQQMTFKYTFDNYARKEATEITMGFIESLRSNVEIVGSINTGEIVISDQTPNDTLENTCSNKAKCTSEAFEFHKYLTQIQMKNSFPSGLVKLCYQKSSTKREYVRMTFLWEYKMTKTAAAPAATNLVCPQKFETVDNDNSVTIYAFI